MVNRYTIHTIHYNLAPCTFWYPENAPYLAFVVRVSLDRLVTYLTAIIKSVTYYTCICSFQINYLIDECFNIGKGANTIISMIHHFFEHPAFGKTKVHLHADNCTGQNKNRFMWWKCTARWCWLECVVWRKQGSKVSLADFTYSLMLRSFLGYHC